MQGKQINGFVLKRPLGVGGMAEVWYAENEIGKRAAVKLLNMELTGNSQIVDRFRSEAEVMVKLEHQNIRQVFGYGSIEGRPAIVMEYLEGNDLKALMVSGHRFTDAELRKWWNQMVSALDYTHKQGVVHRDIKPSNIFIDKNGDVKLMDFGIAKIGEVGTGTQTGSTLGTRLYMSPEQVKDPKRVGPKSDNYSLAVSFVHLLTGKMPYDTTTSSDFDIQLQIVSKPLDMSGVPETWRNFLLPYLEKDPDKRAELMPFKEVALVQETQNVVPDKLQKTTVQGVSYGDETSVENLPAQAQNNTKVGSSETRVESYSQGSTVILDDNKSKSVNKSRKGLWIGLGVGLAVVAVAVVLVFVFLHDNGSSSNNAGNQSKVSSSNGCSTPAEAVEFFIRNMTNGNVKEAMTSVYEYVSASSEEKEEADKEFENEEQIKRLGELYSSIFEKYKIIDEKIDGDNATVKIEVTTMGEKAPMDLTVKKYNGKWYVAFESDVNRSLSEDFEPVLDSTSNLLYIDNDLDIDFETELALNEAALLRACDDWDVYDARFYYRAFAENFYESYIQYIRIAYSTDLPDYLREYSNSIQEIIDNCGCLEYEDRVSIEQDVASEYNERLEKAISEIGMSEY